MTTVSEYALIGNWDDLARDPASDGKHLGDWDNMYLKPLRISVDNQRTYCWQWQLDPMLLWAMQPVYT